MDVSAHVGLCRGGLLPWLFSPPLQQLHVAPLSAHTRTRRLWKDLPEDEAAAAQEAMKCPGYCCNADGSRLPLGPELEVCVGVGRVCMGWGGGAGGQQGACTPSSRLPLLPGWLRHESK